MLSFTAFQGFSKSVQGSRASESLCTAVWSGWMAVNTTWMGEKKQTGFISNLRMHLLAATVPGSRY